MGAKPDANSPLIGRCLVGGIAVIQSSCDVDALITTLRRQG
jgi:hypothetical protein